MRDDLTKEERERKERKEHADEMYRKSSSSRRQSRLKNVKTGGDIMMYIGSAALIAPMIQNAKRNQNGIIRGCASGAGIILSVGLGRLTSKILNNTIDKVADFWDDVKPNSPGEKEAKSDG